MSKFLIVLIFLLAISGCNESIDKSELIGVWVSDREMTLNNIQFKSNGENSKRYKTLEKMLGEMAYVFKETKTTFTPLDTIDQQEQWFSWELIESSRLVYVVKVNVNGENKNIRFLKKEGCIGLVVEVSDFVEYFCKES